MTNNLVRSLIAVFILFTADTCLAADTLAHKYPRAVLVQLRSEHNRIKALTDLKRYGAVEEVKADAKKVSAAMINDFQDNFKYCPVYYFIDTNAEAIKNKQFQGILLNADGTEAHDIVISKSSTDYFTVYYGYPNIIERDTTKNGGHRKVYKANPVLGTQVGRGLVVLNHEYKQIAYFFMLNYSESYFKTKKYRKYTAVSKHYDMQYYPFAGDLYSQITTGEPHRHEFRGRITRPAKY